MEGMKKAIPILAVVLAVLATATSASAYPIRDRTQAPRNVAGGIFHPRTDCFEIWDNVKNRVAVRVSWNYVGIDDRVKKVFSRGRHSLRCARIKDFPRQIYFRVSGLDPEGRLQKSPIVRYPTYD
jgi:hypothetical protein